MTCFLVAITWVFFRAQGFDAALIYLASMFGAVAESKKVLYLNAILPALIVVAGTVLAHWRMRSTSMEAVMEKTLQWVIAVTLTCMLFMLVITQGSDSTFIYFQF